MHIGVVIPLFQQAQYLIECVTSVLSQTLAPRGIVIVNDGCPNPSSDTLSRAIAAAWPQQTLYVRQENRGLSGARNAGIRALLNRWPEIEAILPLDADNWLGAGALAAMTARLKSEDRPDWVYPDKQCFGSEFKNWKAWPRLNPFRLIFDNQCDAASLIRRKVFDAGLFYDETMREGYEDWEFFLRALQCGFRGAAGGQVEFYYRVKKNSMEKRATEKWHEVVKSIHERHPSLLWPWHLTTCEHKYMPRFRFIDEEGKSYDFSDPSVPAAWDQNLDLDYVPPITILGSRAGFELLKLGGVLRGLLFSIQHDLQTRAWRIDLEYRHKGLRFQRGPSLEQTPLLFVFQTKWLKDGVISPENIRSTIATAESIRISASDYSSASKNWDAPNFALLVRHAYALTSSEREMTAAPLESLQESSSAFALRRNLGSFETTYPLSRNHQIDVCFAVPFFRLGGVEQCALKLAQALKQSGKAVRLHLLLTDSGLVDFDRAQLSMFDEIVCVAHCDEDKRLPVLCGILRSMDIVINAHSLQAYQVLPLLPKRSRAVHRPTFISYLHVIEVAANGAPFGYPFVASEYESWIDCFLVISEQLRVFLMNSGVNEERIRIGRNAPVIRPPSREQALLLADQKAVRQSCGRFVLLFAGRLDAQKGLSRLAAFIRLADREGVNLRLTILGSPTLDGEKVDWQSNRVQLVESIREPAILARHFEDADGVILLSRWEGVPLVFLDAMAHGCLVFATDVGAVGELVVDGINGFLCSSSGGDEEIARAALERVKMALLDPSGCREVRRRAVETAMDFSWDQVAAALDDFLVQSSLTQSTDA